MEMKEEMFIKTDPGAEDVKYNWIKQETEEEGNNDVLDNKSDILQMRLAILKESNKILKIILAFLM